MRFPNEEGTLVVSLVAPARWPLSEAGIVGQITAATAEITIRLLPTRQIEVVLRYSNGASVSVTSCPLLFDDHGCRDNMSFGLAMGWRRGELTVCAAGTIIASTESRNTGPSEQTISLVTQEKAELRNLPHDAMIRGAGRVGTVPKAFAAAKEEVERAARQVEALRTCNDLALTADAWKAFLDSFVQTRNKLIGGAEALSSKDGASTWVGELNASIKRSSTLSYLLHARNAQGHGIAAILEREDAELRVFSSGVTHLRQLSIVKGQALVEFGGTPPSMEISPDRVVAVPVTDRGIAYFPPADRPGLFQLSQSGLFFLEECFKGALETFQ